MPTTEKTKDQPNQDEVIEQVRAENAELTKSIGKMQDDLETTLKSMRDRHEANDNDENRKAVDPVDADVIKKQDAAIDGLLDEVKTLKANQTELYGDDFQADKSGITQKQALNTFLKGGLSGMSPAEQKALSAGSDANGGYIVFDDQDTAMGRILSEASPIREIAQVRNTSSGKYTKPHVVAGAGAGWVGETASRPETQSPTIAELEFPVMELYANIFQTQTWLDDAAIDGEAFVAEEARIAFAEQEGNAFVQGDGTGKPKGIIGGYAAVAEASHAWGDIGYIASGAAGAFTASKPADALIDLVYSIKSGYRQNARFLFNRMTQAEIRKLKGEDGEYLWQLSGANHNPTVLGHPITEAEDMPDLAADSLSIAFGDFKRGYLVVDRTGVRVLRDPYSNKPYILLYTTKRVGGGVQDFDAIKLMKFATT